jgi:glyoxylase-like metal-dependent hydrolase (beta-lactamase superfamily II)
VVRGIAAELGKYEIRANSIAPGYVKTGIGTDRGQTEAVAITDTIFMVKDISNAYLVTTGDGDLLVNTGFIGNDERNKDLFAPHRTGPLRRIILTQSHADHYGALPGQLEDGTEVIAGAGFTETADYFDRLAPFLGRRSGKLWASLTRRNGPPPMPHKVVPDIEVAGVHAFEQGGRSFEVHKTPGGETLCAIFVWMPEEKIAFTGNLFGPVWRAMPNLVTIRGDRPGWCAPISNPWSMSGRSRRSSSSPAMASRSAARRGSAPTSTRCTRRSLTSSARPSPG